MPTLLGQTARQREHDHLYWEFRGHQAVRSDRWKAVRLARSNEIELFDLSRDVGETTNVADRHPEIVVRMESILRDAHVDAPHFPLRRPSRRQ